VLRPPGFARPRVGGVLGGCGSVGRRHEGRVSPASIDRVHAPERSADR
jgi:hypothetical protein